jgi:hypothetical protein
MSGPSLPDTDDPWTLLGVEPDAEPDVVRRAYLAKIKVHKPDRAPEAFRRIREAYESITAGAPRAAAPRASQATASHEPAEDGDAAPERGEAPATTASRYVGADDLDTLLAERRTDELFALLQAGRVDPRHTTMLVHVLVTLSVLVDADAFDRLVAACPSEVRELAGGDTVFALRVAGGPAIRLWLAEGHAPCHALLALLVELPVANDARRRTLTRDVADAVRGDPTGTLAALDRIAAAGIDGSMVVSEVLDDVIRNMPDEIFDARMLQINAGGFTHRIDRERSSDRRLAAEGFVGAFASIILASALVRLGVPVIGAIIGIGLCSVAVYVMYDASAAFYRRKLRARLIEQAWAFPVPSQRALAALRHAASSRSADRDAFSRDDFDKYVTLVSEDLALQSFLDLTWTAWAAVTLDAQHDPSADG